MVPSFFHNEIDGELTSLHDKTNCDRIFQLKKIVMKI